MQQAGSQTITYNANTFSKKSSTLKRDDKG